MALIFVVRSTTVILRSVTSGRMVCFRCRVVPNCLVRCNLYSFGIQYLMFRGRTYQWVPTVRRYVAPLNDTIRLCRCFVNGGNNQVSFIYGGGIGRILARPFFQDRDSVSFTGRIRGCVFSISCICFDIRC